MTDFPTALELKALRAVTLGWEDRSKLGGDKTFAALLRNGWIEPFPGFNPDGRKYSLTDAGRKARDLGPAPKVRAPSRLKQLPSRLATLPPRIQKPKG